MTTQVGDPVRRPVVRWHGGKWMLAPWIIRHLPKHRVYVEPFGGGASVLMRKLRSYAEIYNDLDGEIVNLFRVLRDRGNELKEAVRLTPFARQEFELTYEPSDDPLESARRMVARTFMGFGSDSHNRKSGFRAKSHRLGTTPAHDWRHYPDAMEAMTERLRGVVIEHRDARKVMVEMDGPDTLHYVDPPYPHDTRSGISSGKAYRHEMSDAQHVELADCLKGLRGGVVLSSYPSTLYDGLYAKWLRVEREAMADGARPRTEVLYIRSARG